MSEAFTLSSIGINLFWLVIGSLVILPAIIALTFSFKAPFLAVRLIRRNRPLGRNIYCEIAQADRFMDVWMLGGWSSPDVQCQNVLTKNNWDSRAGKTSAIDQELVKLKLLETYIRADNNNMPMVRPKRGAYWLRNFAVFLLLLVLRVSIFGDQYSHIEIPEHCNAKKLKALFWYTVIGLATFVLLLILLISHLF
ncbi:hypothetical protein A3H22_01230 [Candidatus Peribacteria bacterium RIFCSPLOWO2_12_FULL_55_15]|nr:MAG: hypothetical protein A3D12_01905 [Candidatus Peribacteria bacterium RIFCSPHIGHO2_02_FULL_55_24]OGJ67333.1 MAG: hypothetical protein A2947_04180 [Candidatus Peribacteria bacterium RIFCSPLOWO2_01_FULL_54_110]OGJ68732.1 MAG: hypothetical protein A3H90_00265 [Candidatus Peribacteria bacterium RIFCSPLOWO2_02_FULL_55_36]OGJ71010.1 MAG: hypothetical protein A3H22_01230 [Candidatus Peribacteria bacterium RIFCSPLOWO2_12_FULL_55_15]